MEIIYNNSPPHRSAYFKLFTTTGWNKIYNLSAEELEETVLNSNFTVSAYRQGELVGFARIVTDGIIHAIIFDMIVKPEYQNSGIGSSIMEKLLNYCDQNRIRDIQLFCADGRSGFYEKHGFIKRPDEAPGMELRKIY